MSLNEILQPTSTPVSTSLAGHFYSMYVDSSSQSGSSLLPPSHVIASAGATTNIPASWSGSKILVPAIGTTGAVLQLPAVSAGLNYEFVLSANQSGQTVTVKSATANVSGPLTCGPSTLTQVDAAGSTNIIFASSDVKGDWCSVWSDGTSWYAKGNSFVASGFSVS